MSQASYKKLPIASIKTQHRGYHKVTNISPAIPTAAPPPSNIKSKMQMAMQCRVHPQISFSLFALKTSLLLTSLSTPSNLPSHSAQHSPLPTTPTSYHRCSTRAVRTRSSDTAAACSACVCARRSSCGCSAIKAAEDDASGTGRSLRDVRREAVSGKAVA